MEEVQVFQVHCFICSFQSPEVFGALFIAPKTEEKKGLQIRILKEAGIEVVTGILVIDDPERENEGDLVCNEAAKGIAQVGLKTGIPALFGIVTTDNIEQAIERAGTKAGNKGYDVACSAIEMINLVSEIKD